MALRIRSLVVTKMLAGNILKPSTSSVGNWVSLSRIWMRSISLPQKMILSMMSSSLRNTSTVSPLTRKVPILSSVSLREYRASTRRCKSSSRPIWSPTRSWMALAVMSSGLPMP